MKSVIYGRKATDQPVYGRKAQNLWGKKNQPTRTGFLVCTWFELVHTGMFWYVLLYAKLQSTYQYVLSMNQNKVMHI